MNYRSPKLLSLARGQSCVNCGAEDDTTVAAHSNMSEHGKGKSIKAHDVYSAHLCFRCHSWADQGSGKDPTGVYDGTREDKALMMRRAIDRTLLRLFQTGRLIVR